MAAGYSGVSGEVNFTLARYNSSGVLDSSFGSSGIQTTPIGPSLYVSFAFAYSVAVQGDGKIVVAGMAVVSRVAEFALARYTTGGVLDTSFGSSGIQTTSIGTSAEARGVAIQGDGKIVAVGSAGGTFALARYNRTGLLDASFGSFGIQRTYIGTGATASGVALQADGKIVTAGEASTTTSLVFAVARFNGDSTVVTPPTWPSWIVLATGIVIVAGIVAIATALRRVRKPSKFGILSPK